MNDIESGGYLELLADIKQRIRLAQYDALKSGDNEILQPLVGDIRRGK